MTKLKIDSNYDQITVTTQGLMSALEIGYSIHTPVLAMGPPGVGKTEICWQFAKKIGLPFFPIIPSECDPVDFKVPAVYEKDGKRVSTLAISDLLPVEPAMVLIDDITNVLPSMQASLYSLVHKGSLGPYQLPPGSYVCAAGNRTFDKCNSVELSAALKDRCLVVNTEVPDATIWYDDFGVKHGIHSSIHGFIRKNIGIFQTGFDSTLPNAGCTPRSMTKFSDALVKGGIPETIFDKITNGFIGPIVGAQYKKYLDVIKQNIRIEDILSGKHHDIPQDQSLRYCIISELSSRATEKNINNVFKFIEKFDTDLQSLFALELGNKKGGVEIGNVEKSTRLLDLMVKHSHHAI